jgi:hypothetical protein
MSSEPVCQVARSWVEAGRFLHRFGGEVYEFYCVSPEILDRSSSFYSLSVQLYHVIL